MPLVIEAHPKAEFAQYRTHGKARNATLRSEGWPQAHLHPGALHDDPGRRDRNHPGKADQVRIERHQYAPTDQMGGAIGEQRSTIDDDLHGLGGE